MKTLTACTSACVTAMLLALSVEAAEPDKNALAEKAQAILKANCYRCHGEEGSIEGGINYVIDLKSLTSRNKVVPGEPSKSRLYKRIVNEDDPMPPENEKVRPSKADIALLKQWIAAGAPVPKASDAPRKLLSEVEAVRLMGEDLKKELPEDRRFIRYFTINHLANAGLPDDQLQTYRLGLSKLLNSLSWGRKIVVPKPIDPSKTVFRIDMRDYKWGTKIWSLITGEYPYGVLLPGAEAQALYTLAEGELPYVRADWFVYAASRPPLYHQVLDVPYTVKELEKNLRVDVSANIEAGQVARAAFNASGVSRNNRLIERHESPYGAYWKSYDFGGNAGRQNLFACPLGPGTAPRDFQHDGGEIIFPLPNGLQGYMLVDANGIRIDEGPTKIVSDPRQQDRAVVNGISCMSCHARGVIQKSDQVRAHLAKNPTAFTESEAKQIRTLYVPPEKLTSLLEEDADRFKAAVEKTGGRVSGTDPVVALASRFEQDLDLALAAAELGLTPAEFGKRLQSSPALARALGALNVDGGTVQRRALENEFSRAVLDLRIGNPRTLVNSVGMKLNFIPAGEFMMGEADEETEARSSERPRHKVKITKPFYLGVYPVTQEQYKRVMGKNPSWFQPPRGGGPDYPVEMVTWEATGQFLVTLAALEEEKQAKRTYRLPTEAEWEYACRAGTTTRFAFGDLIDRGQANFGGYRRGTTRVGLFAPNRWGLYDMHGNVNQWCSDWYEGPYYTKSPAADPQGPPEPAEKVRIKRGGSWAQPLFWLRSAARQGEAPDKTSQDMGFRVVYVP